MPVIRQSTSTSSPTGARTLYTGFTSDLARRVYEHNNESGKASRRYTACISLSWFDVHEGVSAAILRGKRIKKWRRAWKLELIEKDNPEWNDLYGDITA